MPSQENFERPRMVVGGRIAELNRLAACERGLADAYAEYAAHTHGGSRWLELAERHNAHANILALRVRDMGGEPSDDSEDEWVIGDADDLSTLLYAEHKALRTYHDHLLDLDPESMTLIRERILPAHEQILAELVGERVPLTEL
jgi:hypothetical protein